MSVICEDIPNTEDAKKALYGNIPSLVHARYVGESKIPGLDATKLAPCVLPVFYKKFAAEIESFKVYEDDVWIASYPKCGTTWTQEMIWLISNDLDFEAAKKTVLAARYAFIEHSAILRDLEYVTDKSTVELARKLPRPRYIKTHHPAALLPTEIWTVKPRVVYVARNPKDAAISYYHHYVNLHFFRGNMNDFLDTFLNDLACWSPFCDHVLDFWKLRNEPNILFITYEDMSKDLISVLRKTAKFFNKTYTDDQFQQLAKHLSFSEMKKNTAVNFEQFVDGVEKQYGEKRADSSYKFIRRGQVNSAKDEMPEEYHKKFDDWMAKGFKGSDFSFNV